MPDEINENNAAEGQIVRNLKPPQSFAVNSPNSVESWKLFKQRWTTYTVLSRFDNLDRNIQVHLFLHCPSDESLKVYNGFEFASDDNARTVQEIIDKFEDFIIGETNETYERFIFHQRVQQEGEEFDKFYTDLKTLVKTCNFCDDCVDSMLRDRIILGIRDSTTRTELLKTRNLTLLKCYDMCKAAENAMQHVRAFKPEKDAVNKLESRDGNYNARKPSAVKICKFCGKAHTFGARHCPAYGKTCDKCKKKNHFASKCPDVPKDRRHKGKKKKRIHQVQHDEDDTSESETSYDSEEFINSVENKEISCKNKDVKCLLTTMGKDIAFQIDTGSSVNAIPVKYAENLVRHSSAVSTWNGGKQEILGTTRQRVVNPKNKKKYSIEFVVYSGNFTPILGYNASLRMGFVEVHEENFKKVLATQGF